MRRILATVALLSMGLPALAQQGAIEDLRPQDMRFPDNLGVEELPIPIAPTPPTNDALAISQDVLGPRAGVDEAYGAFQRGYYLTALNLALPRAELQDSAAQTLIGQIYAEGLGVPQNLQSAASWYQMAARNGDAIATFELGLMYQNGRGVARDRARAAELFQRAADMGNLTAKYNLGLLHIEGKYVAPDLAAAARLIGEAADGGLVEALYDHGSMLIEGAGVPPDPVSGAQQIATAAREGLVAAQVDYATLLYLGQGVEKDLGEAVSWYSRAAAAGNAVAQNRYAKLLAVGEGVEPDLEEAAMWRSLARRQGLSDPALDRLLISILPDELARAEERARFWPSQPPSAVADAGPPPEASAAVPSAP